MTGLQLDFDYIMGFFFVLYYGILQEFVMAWRWGEGWKCQHIP